MAVNREALKRVPGGIQGGVCRDLFTEGDEVINHARQDCTPIVDANARLRGHEQYGTQRMGAKLVARVPDIFYYVKWPQEFKEKYGFTKNSSRQAMRLYRDFFLEKLDEREFRYFRVDEGKISGTER